MIVNEKCLIIANGSPPTKRVLNYFIKRGFNFIICADGGANSALKMNVKPDIIIGDLDSISNAALKHYSRMNVKINKLTRQNDTDVEKCIKFAIKNKFREVILLGSTGDRLDHTFCNIGVLLKFSSKINICLYHENTLMYPITGKNKIETVKGETISFYGINRQTIFNAKELKYPLNNVSLPFGEKESTSNIATGNKLHIEIKNGYGLIVRQFKIVKDHGYLLFT